MKRIGLLVMVLVSIILIGANLKEKKKNFEGTITYEISYIKVTAELEGMESMLPKEMVLSFKESKMSLMQEVMGGSQTVVIDNADSSSFVLMNMLGQKIAINITKEELRKSAKETTESKISYSEDVKTILGYKCKKASISQDSTTTEIYYTNKLNIKHKDFQSLVGFPLEYQSDQDGMKLLISATQVVEEEVDDSLFEIPEGYTIMTMEELEDMMGGK